MDKLGRGLDGDREVYPLILGDDGMRDRAENSSCESDCDCDCDLNTSDDQ